MFLQLRDLESELDEERKAKVNAVNSKKKIEMDIADLEDQLEGANRVKEDSLKQLKKYQQQLKDIQRDLDEARHARDEISEQAKENERKAKQLEADYLQMQEVRSGALETMFMSSDSHWYQSPTKMHTDCSWFPSLYCDWVIESESLWVPRWRAVRVNDAFYLKDLGQI